MSFLENSLFEVLLLFLWIVQFLITRHYAKKDLVQETLAVLTYHSLSNKLNELISKKYATADERHELTLLYDIYKKHGWNGDMDARMKAVYLLPFENPEVNKIEN